MNELDKYKNLLRKSMESTFLEVKREFDNYLKGIECADTHKDALNLKRKLLVGIVTSLPIYGNTCSYCIHSLMHGGCRECEFQKLKGDCSGEWKKVRCQIDKLQLEIIKFYCLPEKKERIE